MDLSGLSGAIGGIVAVLALRWILSRIHSTPEVSKDGLKVLRYHRSYEVIGWGSSGLFLIGLVATLVTGPHEVRIVGGIVFGSLTLLGFFLIWLVRRCTISYTETEVRYSPLFTSSFSFPWSSIVSAKYSTVSQWWVFQLADGRKARVSIYMNGHKQFIETARWHLTIPIPEATTPCFVR